MFTNQELHNNAKTIIQVLRAQLNILWSWGARSYVYLTYENMMSLRFRVSGLKHKGYVLVSLNQGKDLYEVRIINLKGHVKATVEGVYFDQLTDVIDLLVENGTMSNAEY